MFKVRMTRLLCFVALVFGSSITLAGARQVAVSVVVDIPLDEAWNYLQDFSVAHKYVPDLTGTTIVSSQQSGVGAQRRVFMDGGDFLEETVIEWRDGEGFVIRLHNGDEPMMPFERAEFSYSIRDYGDNKTLIVLMMLYEMPFGSFGETLGEWFIDSAIADELIQVAAGMKHYYETGMPATDQDREKLAGYVRVNEAIGSN